MTYESFIKELIRKALKVAEKYGYDQPIVTPEGIEELELFLQEILGVIHFNEKVNKFYREK